MSDSEHALDKNWLDLSEMPLPVAQWVRLGGRWKAKIHRRGPNIQPQRMSTLLVERICNRLYRDFQFQLSKTKVGFTHDPTSTMSRVNMSFKFKLEGSRRRFEQCSQKDFSDFRRNFFKFSCRSHAQIGVVPTITYEHSRNRKNISHHNLDISIYYHHAIQSRHLSLCERYFKIQSRTTYPRLSEGGRVLDLSNTIFGGPQPNFFAKDGKLNLKSNMATEPGLLVFRGPTSKI